eukprot:CAMPEP_0119397826 /NCGR_PEP_ID=MMETSP1334-20130426/140532_1 /TAXON_ID=127549 /ORGANISM="Calcidiscus leptoporus, Strain RCC1130" /LENGTH=285 /DNA_ID=CAMNT_0007421673 /DNA_START=236 /DNA_END=1093 /DNA_ORIENTATION=-
MHAREMLRYPPRRRSPSITPTRALAALLVASALMATISYAAISLRGDADGTSSSVLRHAGWATDGSAVRRARRDSAGSSRPAGGVRGDVRGGDGAQSLQAQSLEAQTQAEATRGKVIARDVTARYHGYEIRDVGAQQSDADANLRDRTNDELDKLEAAKEDTQRLLHALDAADAPKSALHTPSAMRSSVDFRLASEPHGKAVAARARLSSAEAFDRASDLVAAARGADAHAEGTNKKRKPLHRAKAELRLKEVPKKRRSGGRTHAQQRKPAGRTAAKHLHSSVGR